MATVAPTADQTADMMQKITLDPQANVVEIPDATKKNPVDSNNISNGAQTDRSNTPVLPDISDPAVCYTTNGYNPTTCYYGAYDWDSARFTSPEGVEMPAGVYGENTPFLLPGYGYSYPPYSPAVSPVPTLGHDIYGAQQYQYPTPYFQSVTPTNGQYGNSAAPTKGQAAASRTVQDSLPVDSTNSKSNVTTAHGGGAKANNNLVTRPTYHSSSYSLNGSYARASLPGGMPTSSFQDPRYVYDGLHSPIPWLETTYYSDAQPRLMTSSSMTTSIPNVNSLHSSRNQSFQPQMGLHHPRYLSGFNTASGSMNRMYPNKFYGQYGATYKSGTGYGSSDYTSRTNGRGWMNYDNKYKPRGRANDLFFYGGENMDGLNELNRGPRTKSSKNTKSLTPVTLAVKGQSLPLSETTENEKSATTPDKEQYNRPDFPEQYDDAKFFVIKSYSEDDIHKSIKYNTWASTENGNKKLDAAYLEAQQKPGGCPVFLFFSVNTSGQFVGVAEMLGPVDFNKNVEYWQQDKWIGCFPVKWHIVKDVPNSSLKHITLENNENKPVTNSRDTQEVKLEQGLKILKIFKDNPCKQSVLDDFDFYEERQKKILEKKGKLRQFQKQVEKAQIWEGKPTEENAPDNLSPDLRPQASPDVVANSIHPASPRLPISDSNAAENSSPLAVSSESVVTAKAVPVPEKKRVANGIANCC